jgi:hypothetical protein
MRRYVELIIIYNLSPSMSFLVNRKYSYVCLTLEINQGQAVQRTDQNTMPISTISTQYENSGTVHAASQPKAYD